MYNGHADVTALIAEDGTIAATYYYDAFGNILESTGDVDNNICYSGYQYDEETELYYLNARMYDPKIARFLQEDTYTGDKNDPLSLNLYTYCANRPIIYTDPTGHKALNLSDYSNTPVNSVFNRFKKKVKKKILEPVANFAGGIAISIVKDMVVDPVIDIGCLGLSFAEEAGLVDIQKNSPKELYSYAKKTEEKFEKSIEDDFVTNKTAYYGGRVVTDASISAFGIVTAFNGITNLVSAASATVGGDLLTVETGIGPFVVTAAGACVSVGCIAETGYGVDVAYRSFSNASSNYDKLRNSIAEGMGKLNSPSEVQQLLNNMPELTGTNREMLESVIQDGDLWKEVDQLYRPGPTTGDGGTATKLMQEYLEGSSKHLQKATERLDNLKKLVETGNLGLNDLDIAEALITDLENAIKLFK